VPTPPESAPAVIRGPLITVDDPADHRLDLYRDLNDPAARTQLDADRAVFIVEGRLAVERLLTSGYAVRSLLVDDHQVTAAGGLVTATRATGAPVFVGPRPVVAATVGFDLHRGVVAVADRPEPTGCDQVLAAVRAAHPVDGPPIVAVLEGLNDHENIGALFRNAAAFGVGGVLLDPACADPLYRRSIRVSVGHVLHLPFGRLTPWPAGLDQVRAAGFIAAALAPPRPDDGGPVAIGLSELRDRAAGTGHAVALLCGAEGPGLTDAALAASDVVVTIPMAAGVDSLNVATAAAVAFHALASG
jgi:tRNA G18 (ribose-2'-O)-methylase SpoU